MVKNEFLKFMREHNIDVEDRVWLDIIPGFALSVIPEFNFHYRDEEGYMHIAPRSAPHSVHLNTYVFEEVDGMLQLMEDMHRIISTVDELNEYLKELPDLIHDVQNS